MSRGYNPSDEIFRELVAAYERGDTLGAVGFSQGITRRVITDLFKERGVPLRKRGKTPVPKSADGKKRCKGCAKYKDHEDFQRSETTTDGMQSYCRKCSGAASARYRMKKQFGIDRDGYDRLLKEQNYVCAICRKAEFV